MKGATSGSLFWDTIESCLKYAMVPCFALSKRRREDSIVKNKDRPNQMKTLYVLACLLAIVIPLQASSSSSGSHERRLQRLHQKLYRHHLYLVVEIIKLLSGLSKMKPTEILLRFSTVLFLGPFKV
uniref:Uncharacterized protein n=1 Tax=Sphaerodactylus townsendi TaxID=933632 RepID=A0ACB8ESK8_9SAUR